jgi:hypothetical protein
MTLILPKISKVFDVLAPEILLQKSTKFFAFYDFKIAQFTALKSQEIGVNCQDIVANFFSADIALILFLTPHNYASQCFLLKQHLPSGFNGSLAFR